MSLIERTQHGRVLQIALNRPDKRNALNVALCRTLVRAFEEANTEGATGAVLLTANGPAFCSGMDLQEAVETSPDDLTALHERLFTAIHWMRKPVVAMIHGGALAGGLGIVANSHIAIASPAARFGLTEIRVGLWPILIYRACTLAMGERRATELSLTGRIFTADDALHYGLVTEVSDHAETRAREIAESLSHHSPVAAAAGLDYVDRIRAVTWDEAGRIGQSIREGLMAGGDFKEGVNAFLEKRKPAWPSIKY